MPFFELCEKYALELTQAENINARLRDDLHNNEQQLRSNAKTIQDMQYVNVI